jgi:hypothetical protein
MKMKKGYKNAIVDDCLIGECKDFDFLHLVTAQTREKCLPVQSGVVGVTVAKIASATNDVCVEVFCNINVTEVSTA